jgi:hypothetical protein
MRSAPAPTIVHELDKKEGLHYAFTESGLELPVIDIGHPAFRVAESRVELQALVDSAAADREARAAIPNLLQIAAAKAVARHSILARELLAARGGYVSGLGTYLIKLGPELLGEGYASAVDRRIAGTIMGVNARIRLRETAALLARSIEGRLAAWAGRPLVLFAIAGGPSAESLNALMSIRRERPELLEGRRLRIYVLDRDDSGPAFGARSLDSLKKSGAPLHGLDVALLRVAYDWNDPSTLQTLARDAGDSIVAASSEGGLFEYGSDEAIRSNLEALGASPGATIVGSLSIGEGRVGAINRSSGAAIRARPCGGGQLEEAPSVSGWRMIASVCTPLSRVFALERSE